MNIKQFCVLIIAVVLFSACDKNPYHKKVSNIQVDFSIEQFHSDIQQLAKNYTIENQQKLQTKYGSFFNSYLADVQKHFYPDLSIDSALIKFMDEKWTQELYQKSDSCFSKNEKAFNKKIRNALQYYKYYFPNKEIPNFYTFITGVNYSMAIDSNVIAIGIDKYLGANCDFYNSMTIESYIKRNMTPEKLPSDLMRALAEYDYPEMFDEDYLLAKMLQCGRYQYFVKCMLPDEPDSLLWGFTQQQMTFCEKSEGEFWKYLISTDNILFSTDYMVQKRFIDDGPFTIVFTKDSPARVGQWIGFKIVESFMQNNPNITIEELFSIKSAKEIMNKAKYNPK